MDGVLIKFFLDVASGISFEKRKDFYSMLDDIVFWKVRKSRCNLQRLNRIGFELFYHLFKKYNTEIIVMSEVGSEKLDSEEIFEEIVSLLDCYSIKLYSKRKAQRIKEVLEDKKSYEEAESFMEAKVR